MPLKKQWTEIKPLKIRHLEKFMSYTNIYYELAKKKGWWDAPIPIDLAKLRLHEEVTEAFHDIAKHKDPGIEFADIFILSQSYLGGYENGQIQPGQIVNPYVDRLSKIHEIIESDNPFDFKLAQIISIIMTVPNIDQVIKAKFEINQQRPNMHGRVF